MTLFHSLIQFSSLKGNIFVQEEAVCLNPILSTPFPGAGHCNGQKEPPVVPADSSETQSSSQHLCYPIKAHKHWGLQSQHCPVKLSWHLRWNFCPMLTREPVASCSGGQGRARHPATRQGPSAAMFLVSSCQGLGKPSLKDLQSHVRGKEKRGE